MDVIKINTNSPIGTIKALNIKDMIETDSELLITLNDRECYNIYSGTLLSFKRFIYESGTTFKTLTEYVRVIEEDENHIIHTEKPPVRKVRISNDADSAIWVSGITENEGVEWYGHWILKCGEEHNIFPQDLSLNNGEEIYVKDYQGNLLGTYRYLGVPLKRKDRQTTVKDCLTFIGKEEACGKQYDFVDIYRYDFLPEEISRDRLIVQDFNSAITETMAYFETKYNAFYYTYINQDDNGNPTEIDDNGNPVRHCRFYNDAWWFELQNSVSYGDVLYINSGNASSIISLNTGYWNINIGLSNADDETNLGSEDKFGTSYIEDIEESLIPEVIDMERIKYIPYEYSRSTPTNRHFKWVTTEFDDHPSIYTNIWLSPDTTTNGRKVSAFYKNGDDFNEITDSEFKYTIEYNLSFENGMQTYILRNLNGNTGRYYLTEEITSDELSIATSITMYFHFRKREEISPTDRGSNSKFTSGNTYYDGWYINSDSINTTWWNGMAYEEEEFSLDSFNSFINNSGKTSDLLGYLNFNDNDIYYQKQKVSQSFIRLTFYTSKDPVEQKLLFYSTIFLDGGELYGKFLKQKQYMTETGIISAFTNQNCAVVFCSANTVSARVDSELFITNEYDRTRSAEGFNIYLFAEDKNLNLENGEKTIYMKVEFNHAGNGSTVPLIQWPKSSEDNVNGDYIPLTVDNFIDKLYIPVKLVYLNGSYGYYIPSSYENSDGNIKLVLFEPKLDYQEQSTEGIQ